MREAFEKLPEIARYIHKFVYQDDLNCYRNKIKSSDIHLVTWVNGAWYAFQEQQAKAQMARDEKTYAINRWTAVCKERDDLKAQLECCRKENAVLLGRVGELQERIDTTKSSQSKLHKTEMGDCLHFNTTMFHEGKATCFECDAVVNHKRKVIGVMQTRTLRGEHEGR